MTPKALEGMKVLEYCNMVSGPYCAKLLADLGAEVLKIEPPGRGDDARRRGPLPVSRMSGRLDRAASNFLSLSFSCRRIGPFFKDIPHPEKSGLFLYLNSNKKGLTLDPYAPEGKEVFQKLVAETDLLIEDRPPGEMAIHGLDYDSLKKISPSLIQLSITPYGLTGPYKDYKAYQLNTVHVSGQGYMLPLIAPDLERPPVKVGGHSSGFDVGLVAVVAATAAYYHRLITGQGQFIELSKQEALMSMQRVESVTYTNDGVVLTRGGDQARKMPGGILPCKDGYIVIVTPEEHQWRALVQLIGNPSWAEEPWCQTVQARAQNADLINQRIMEWTRQHTREEIFHQGQALSCPVAPVNTAEDIARSEQFRARNFFTEMDHPEVGRIPFPTASFRFSKTPWSLERPAPILGQHNEEIYHCRLGYGREKLTEWKTKGVI